MDIKTLTTELSVAGQILPTQLAEIARAGFKSVICNRPDGEAPDQPPFSAIEAAAEQAGLAVAYLPVTSATLDAQKGAAFAMLMAQLPKPVLAYCRSGARSTTLASLANIRPDEVETGLSRRALIVAAGAVAAASTALLALGGRAHSEPLATKARIAIIGGGFVPDTLGIRQEGRG